MDVSIELVFFFVFLVPMAIMVTLNLLLHRTLPDVAAPWVRLAGPAHDLEPEQPAPLPAAEAEAQASNASNEEEALEAA